MSLIDDVAPGLAGLETLKALIDAGGRPPIGETLGQTLVDVAEGWACFVAHPSPAVYNPMGTVHGGYISTILDSACGCAVHSKLSAQQLYTTLELKVSFLKAIVAGSGPIRAEGRAISVGRRAAFAEATLTDASGRICATASSTLMVFERR